MQRARARLRQVPSSAEARCRTRHPSVDMPALSNAALWKKCPKARQGRRTCALATACGLRCSIRPIVTVFDAFQKDAIPLVTHEGVGHDKLSDLKGKPIRLPAIARTNYWPWLKSKFGFTDEQIRGFEPGYAALGSDKMLSQQGYATNDAWNARKVGLNLKSLLLADYGWANYATTVDATEKTLRERPEIVRAFVRASREGWKGYLDNPAKAHAAIKKDNQQMEMELMEFSHSEMKRLGLIDSGDPRGGRIGGLHAERSERLQE